jgi:hypothetical protein
VDELESKMVTAVGYSPRPGEHAVIAVPPQFAKHAPGTNTVLDHCHYCNGEVLIDVVNQERVIQGWYLLCLRCAYYKYPNMIAGFDPGTGKPFTIREWWDQKLKGEFR